MWVNCLAVGMGGFCGAVFRYLLGFIPGYYYLDFPLGTMLINLVGAFCIGMLAGLIPAGLLSSQQQLFLKTGLCGGFTTFSTFSLETLNLLEQGHILEAGSYVFCSVVLCLIGAFFGKLLAMRLFV